MMGACRLLMIDKKGGGQRPIAIGHIYRRLAGRFLERTSRKSLIEAFGPKQMATQPNGTSTAAPSMQINIETHSEHVLVAMDCSNAFTSAWRSVLLRWLIKLTPWNFSYAKTFYNSPAMLWVVQAQKEEDKFIWSSEGTQQGCPLDMTMFCAGMISIIQGAEKLHILLWTWE